MKSATASSATVVHRSWASTATAELRSLAINEIRSYTVD